MNRKDMFQHMVSTASGRHCFVHAPFDTDPNRLGSPYFWTLDFNLSVTGTSPASILEDEGYRNIRIACFDLMQVQLLKPALAEDPCRIFCTVDSASEYAARLDMSIGC